MKLADMRFRVIRDGVPFEFGWNDIFGYEGETCGVFARVASPTRFRDDIRLTSNSGYGFKGINGDLEIEVFEAKEG